MAKKEIPYVHDKHQIKTVTTTLKSIMWRKEFIWGAEDAAKGLPFRPEYDRWSHPNKQWSYERGRIYGLRTKGEIPIKNGKKISWKALEAYANICISGDCR